VVRTRSLLSALLILVLLVVVARGQSSAPPDRAEALAEAARKGDAMAVKRLLDEGVDVNTKYRYGATALAYACDRGHLDVVKLLLDRGAEVNLKDTFYGATPLTWASSPAMGRKPQHAEIVGLLLKRGAQGQEDALRSATSENDAPMVKVILDHGGLSPDALSDALESARNNKRDTLVALLEQAGAKPRVEFKIDEAQLARYAGTYRGPGDMDLILTVADGRLTANVPGRRLTFVARDATTFGVVEAPGATLTFHLEGDKVTSIGFPSNATTWTRVEGK
jgi:Ankyrin repeats (3 copies)